MPKYGNQQPLLFFVQDGQLSGAGDQLIVVGAASKGIIQRDHQHNAVVYRQYYAANPFENMSEADIEKYQREVQRKEAGEPEPEPEPGMKFICVCYFFFVKGGRGSQYHRSFCHRCTTSIVCIFYNLVALSTHTHTLFAL